MNWQRKGKRSMRYVVSVCMILYIVAPESLRHKQLAQTQLEGLLGLLQVSLRHLAIARGATIRC